MNDFDTAVVHVFDLYTAYETHGDWDRFLEERAPYLASLGWSVDEFLERSDAYTVN